MTPLLDGKEKYIVTPCGRIFSRGRWRIVSPRGYPQRQFYRGKELKPQKTKEGYLSVGLWLHGKQFRYLVHRIVAQKYLPNPDRLPEVNHINLDKTDNRVSNLEWVSREQNLKHAEENGMKRIGETVGTSKLTEKEVLEIVKLLDEGVPQTAVGSIFGVSNHAIYRIAKGHNWSWLTGIGRKEGEQ